MIEAVVWDIDGVILDTEEIHAKTESETARAFGIEIDPKEVGRLYSGVAIETEFEDMAKRFNIDIPLAQALEIQRQILERRLQEDIPVVPHAKEVLVELSTRFNQGFVTSSPRYFIEEALKKLGFLNLFQARVYSDDVQHKKPNPEPFLKAASILQVEPSCTLAVEDSVSGFKAAKAAGMLLIGRKAEHNNDKDFSLADYVVEDLREIPEILIRIKQNSHGRGKNE